MPANYLDFLSNLHRRDRQLAEHNNERWQSQLVIGPLLNALSHKKQEVFFVQVGACDGALHDPIRSFILRYDWRGILVEPLPDLFAKLKENYTGRDKLVFENVAIAESKGKKSLKRVNPAALEKFPEWAAGCATFIEDSKNIASCPELYDHLVSEDVNTMSLPALLEKHAVTHIDVLQIDTEGYDYKVLSQLDFSRYKPLVINMEYVHLTDEEKMTTCALLTEHGYAFRTHHLDLLAAQKTLLDELHNK